MTRPARSALLLTALLLVACFGAPIHAQTRPTTAPATQPAGRFAYVDIYVDPHGKPLAAYQLEFRADSDSVALVGIEGGEHAAFTQPPYYDPAALYHNSVILAAFNTSGDLPTARTRVARLHLRLTTSVQPHYEIKLATAASSEGSPLPDATATIGQGDHP
jgi:hypothetical protein